MTTTKDESLLDIGRLCSVCQRVDFLPFTCPHCSVSFCTDHRTNFNEHECKALKLKKQTTISTPVPSTIKSSSLFPDLDKIRKQAELDRKPKQTLATSSDSAALQKLKSFISFHKSKSKPLFRLKKSTPASRMVELAKMKNLAVGDVKISGSERVHIWVQYVPDESKFGNAELTERKALFVSKSWPVGRLLDFASTAMKIKNDNNRTTESIKKLTIFRHRRDGESSEEEYIYVPANGRVVKEISDGDIVYIVRGADVTK
ncbi:hypothetical protein OGAPHI_000311 [Ogataea philodendri]|uniref:AN1-type domain-containing protein n=1 Tax=Ogataea philodendri TaxID=1378263 RepID=A0A9P8PG16_9ASCO|nr:uncharacterized protein OGAPHI_000311 [Ogataea philodendri]KAH3671608.1 hypothetical protein OGAPHI_000311 [Ogataea philodendri]